MNKTWSMYVFKPKTYSEQEVYSNERAHNKFRQ